MSRSRKFSIDLTEQFPHLSSAPIVEGVINWRTRGKPLLSTAEVKSQLSTRLPDYPEIQETHQIEFEASMNRGGESTSRVAAPRWTGIRLLSADRLQIAQFTLDGFSFSRLAPYTEWDTFSNEAKRLWRLYVEYFSPSLIQRLGVRFINRMELVDPDELTSRLQRPPECLQRIGLPMTSFMLQAIHDVPGYSYQVQVTQALQPPSPPKTAEVGLIVDIDVGTTIELAADSEFDRRLLEMRWLKNKTFLAVLTSENVEALKEVPHE